MSKKTTLKATRTLILCKRGEQPVGYVEMKGGTNPHYGYYLSEKAI